MTVLAVTSGSGAPGATTTALLLAAALPWHPVVVEANPLGGTLAGVCDLHWNPGVASLAAVVRDELSATLLAEHSQRSTVGVQVVPGPASAIEAGPALTHLAPLLGGLLASGHLDAIVDCGSLWPASPSWPLAVGADLTLLAVRQYPEQHRQTAARISHAHALAAALGHAGAGVAVVVIGRQPYDADEIAAAVGVPVVGVLPHDPAGVRAGLAGERPKSWRRLATTTGQLGERVVATLARDAGVHAADAVTGKRWSRPQRVRLQREPLGGAL